jgi:hypothetical protein
MVADVAKFHHTCPILPAHKKWFILKGPDGLFYIEHNTPFGCSSSSSNTGMIGSALADIWEAEGVKPTNRYEDDFLNFRFPTSLTIDECTGIGTYDYPYDRLTALALIACVGCPWHDTKWLDFCDVFVYIGLEWDLTQCTVAVPEAKHIKFRERVRSLLAKASAEQVGMMDIMKIHGSLCHIAFVHQDGCSHLPAFSSFTADFNNNRYAKGWPPSAVFTEL